MEEMKCAYCGRDLNHDSDCGHEPTPEMEAKMKIWEEEMMKKHGFYVHYTPIPNSWFVNCHTHGLPESFSHPELQVIIPLPQEVMVGIMHNAVDMIRKGHNFTDGDLVNEIITNWAILPIMMKDDENKDIVRLILPDKFGRYPDDEKCNSTMKIQKEIGLPVYKPHWVRGQEQRERSGNNILQATFTYHFVSSGNEVVLVIIDKNEGQKSVTNDIENVIEMIVAETDNDEVWNMIKIAKDSDGFYDEIQMYTSREFGGAAMFLPCRTENEERAIEIAVDRKNTGKLEAPLRLDKKVIQLHGKGEKQ